MSKALDLFFFFGRPFSPIYGALMKSREKLYHRGVFHQQSLAVPVISIGNLVLGGTGKTPTVRHVARLLKNHGYHPAIVSRGYQGEAQKAVNIVSDNEKIYLSAALAGDEPYMLAASLPGIPVLTGKHRIFPCRYAIDRIECDVIILDDGFQHLSVKRDIDLVLFDSTILAGSSRIFPGGPLREPTSALNRCHGFLLTGTTKKNKERAQSFSNLLQQRFPRQPVFKSFLASSKLVSKDNAFAEKSVPKIFFGFCGIANPVRFENALVSHGLQLAGFQALRDHTAYSQPLVSHLCASAVKLGADSLVTTEKDFVKLQGLNTSLPLHVLLIEQRIEQSFDLFLLNSLNNLRKQAPD
jgi:tetraacyldisaccharide 4'-kinase